MRSAVPALTGYLTGAFALTVLIGLGLDAALFGRPEVMRPMQLAGAAYMLWLAWGFLKAGGESGADPSPQARSPLAGALVLLLNPKAYLIVALTLAQFARGGQSPVYVVLVGVVVVLTYILAFGLWAGASAGVDRTLGARRLNVLYAASVTLAAVRGRRPAERSTLLPR